jgi:hypothetical protein
MAMDNVRALRSYIEELPGPRKIKVFVPKFLLQPVERI